MDEQTTAKVQETPQSGGTKFCKFCGKSIPQDAVICTHCGRQVEDLHRTEQPSPNIVINNNNENVNTNTNIQMNGYPAGKAKDKWVAVLLCFFLGFFGAHKFYEGKIGLGILYLLTGGLFVIGVIVDFFVLLTKPNPYYVPEG